jgi:transcriptional regulator with XRE-family HTH domain
MNSKLMNGSRALALRKSLKLNQYEFWHRVGVTQSGGSRYEGNRRIPLPVRLLLQLAYDKDPSGAMKKIRYR